MGILVLNDIRSSHLILLFLQCKIFLIFFNMARNGVERALQIIRDMPRVGLNNIQPLPGIKAKQLPLRGRYNNRRMGHKGQTEHRTLPPLGFEGGNVPWYKKQPLEPYYAEFHERRQYPPISLLQIQRLVDLGRINNTELVDITTLCNTKFISLDTSRNHYGFNLTDEESDCFKAKVNIEVQWTNELSIAAVEKNGGIIISRFYDIQCVSAMSDALDFFRQGIPIPKCKLPPANAIDFYSNPLNRGYLSDPHKMNEARLELAQKYGYKLILSSEEYIEKLYELLKDPRQIWFGLNPGWIVNLKDKCILKPVDELFESHYSQ